ncbi:MAG TPA: methyl-accepting chemotaxis protein [Nitrospiraceae bacterium]|nr:methyl-accepting chemotaxis protein [Nitrospiraceae bacterium]
MPTATIAAPPAADRRAGFFVHRVQKGYAVWIGLILFLYSALFFTLAFYGPHLKPMLTLYGESPLEERQAAAAEMLMLSETVWVAVPVLFFGAVIFSLVLTRRVAGPLYRLDECVQKWAKGYLSWRVGFRASDRLDDLAGTANRAMENIERSFARIQQNNQAIQAALSKMEAQGPPGLMEARQATEDIAAVLTQFEFKQTV